MKKIIIISVCVISAITGIVVVLASQNLTFTAKKADFTIEINGKEKVFEMPIVTIEDRTYLPLRETSEALGADIEWIGEEQKIVITTEEQKNNEQIKVAIFPSSGGRSETYLFVLNDNGELIVECGTRNEEDVTQNTFIIKDSVYDYETEQKRLSSSEINTIISLTNKIYESDFGTSDRMVFDSWTVQIIYKDKIVKQTYWDGNIPQQMQDLVDEIIQLSPIEVDLREFA